MSRTVYDIAYTFSSSPKIEVNYRNYFWPMMKGLFTGAFQMKWLYRFNVIECISGLNLVFYPVFTILEILLCILLTEYNAGQTTMSPTLLNF